MVIIIHMVVVNLEVSDGWCDDDDFGSDSDDNHYYYHINCDGSHFGLVYNEVFCLVISIKINISSLRAVTTAIIAL